MPDAPKNSADDEAMLEALNRWTGFPRGEIRRGFMAGWRAAMAEVKKETATQALIVHTANCNITEKLSDVCSCGASAEDVRWDRRNV